MAISEEVRKEAQALVEKGNYTAAKKLVEQHRGSWPHDLTKDRPPRTFRSRALGSLSVR